MFNELEYIGDEPLVIKASVIDYIGELYGGVSVHISLTLADDFSFESIYWIHPNSEIDTLLDIDDRFVKKIFGSESVESLPFYPELIKEIESILPERSEIFKEFL